MARVEARRSGHLEIEIEVEGSPIRRS